MPEDLEIVMEASPLGGFQMTIFERSTGQGRITFECSLDDAIKLSEQIKETVREPLLHIGVAS